MSGLNKERVLRPLNAQWACELPDFIRTLEASPDGQWLAVGDASGAISLLSCASGELRQQWTPSSEPVDTLYWPTADHLLGTAGNQVFLEELSGDAPQRQLDLEVDAFWIEDLTLGPQGDRFALCAKKTASVYQLDGTLLFETPEHHTTISGLAFMGPRRLATACYGHVHIWDIASGEEAHQFNWKGSLFRPHPSPDAKVVACGCQDNSIHFWRVTSGKDSQMTGYPGKPNHLDWSHDSTLLATASSRILLTWDFSGDGPENTKPYVLDMHDTPITAMAFHPQKPIVLSGDEEGMALLWKPRTDEMPFAFTTLTSSLSELHWHPDGQTFFLGSETGQLGRFQLG